MERIDRVNEKIKREVSELVRQELQDPKLQFVTITKVEASKDLRHARISFSVLGSDKDAEYADKKLNDAKGHIRKLLGARLFMRYTPEIYFVHDKSIKYSIQIEKALREIHEGHDEDTETH